MRSRSHDHGRQPVCCLSPQLPTPGPEAVTPAQPGLYAAVMTLNADEYELLRLIAQSPEPVAASDFFHTIHPANFERSVAEEDPRRVA